MELKDLRLKYCEPLHPFCEEYKGYIGFNQLKRTRFCSYSTKPIENKNKTKRKWGITLL